MNTFIFIKRSHVTACLFLGMLTATSELALSQDGGSISRLKQELKNLAATKNGKNDTAYINRLTDLAYAYSFGYPDSALLILSGNAERCKALGYKKGETDTYLVTGDAYLSKGVYDKALQNFELAYRLAKGSGFQKVASAALNRIGTVYLNRGNYPEALSRFYEALQSAEAIGNNELAGAALNNIATVQFYQNMFSEAESTYLRRLTIAQNMNDTNSMSNAYNNIGEVNLKQNQPTKALQNLTLANRLASQTNDREMMMYTTLSIAEAYYKSDSLQKAATLFEEGKQLAKESAQESSVCNALIGLAKVYYKQGLLKEALANGLEGLQKAQAMGQVQLMRDASEIVSTVYQAMNDNGKALAYYKTYKLLSDSMNSLESQQAVAIEKDKYDFSKKESEFEQKATQQHWLIISTCAGLALLIAILWIIIRNRNRLLQTYKELQTKNAVIETEKLKTEETLMQLQATQAQLIQSEKMASLGELTAGIAHEIQNPLNFVNNFSEVNKELLAEMEEEIDKGNYGEAKLIATDLTANEEKISHHGKRADAIVKSMLQHSRRSTGQKEPANINALCDEYIRLAYHGLRAKDKSFQAGFTTEFDATAGIATVILQDMGRVLLNLCNNAFYAVNEKKKRSDTGYQPLVVVATKRTGNNIEIMVRDNGTGIPQNITGKIFQPFFTTKPTGQGTGLGLSLAYDIITKEHNGTIRAESKEGEGTMFTISIPAS